MRIARLHTLTAGAIVRFPVLVVLLAIAPMSAIASSSISIYPVSLRPYAATGGINVFDVFVANQGPDDALNFTLTANFPSGVIYQGGGDEYQDITCTSAPAGGGGTTATCKMAYPLSMVYAAQIRFSFDLDPSVPDLTQLTLTFFATADNDSTHGSHATASFRVAGLTDLAIAQTPPGMPIVPGATGTALITLSNLGPSVARDVYLTIGASSPLHYTGTGAAFQDNTFGCQGKHACQVAPLTPGTSITFPVTVTTDPATLPPEMVSLESQVAMTNVNTDGSRGMAVTNIPVAQPQSDLAAALSTAASAPIYGELQVQIGATGTGPSAASMPTLRYDLPANATYVSGAAGCTTPPVDATGSVTCVLFSVNPGNPPFGTTLTIRPVGSGTLTHSATVTWDGIDPNPANNTATASTTVVGNVQHSALSITNSVSKSVVLEAERITETIVVTNSGPDAAAHVVVRQSSGYYDNLTGPCVIEGFATTSPAMVCTFPTLASGASATMTRTYPIYPLGDNALTATLTSPTDPGTANHTATTHVLVLPTISLNVSASADATTVDPGSLVTFTMKVFADGNPVDLSVTDTMNGATLVTAPPFCSGTSPIVCTPPLSTTWQLVFRMPSTPGVYTNTITALATNNINPNNRASTDVHVNGAPAAAKLTATVSAVPNQVTAGGVVTYSLFVQNTGSAAAPALTIHDVLPAGSVMTGYSPAAAACSGVGETVTCTWPGLQANGDGIALAITTKAPVVPGIYTDSLQVTSPGSMLPASAAADIRVVPVTPGSAKLTASATAMPSVVGAGDVVTCSISIQNVGSADASPVTISNALPAGFTLEAYSPASAGCNGTAGTITCTWASLQASSALVTLTLTARAPKVAGAYVDNVAVTSPGAVPGSASAGIQVVTGLLPGTITLAMNASPATVTVGGRVTVTMVSSNSGDSAASDVSIAFAVPAAGSLVNAVHPSQGSCIRTTSMIFCEMGSIGARQNAAVAVDLTAPPTPMTLGLTATQGVSADAISGGDHATASVTVVPLSRRRVAGRR